MELELPVDTIKHTHTHLQYTHTHTHTSFAHKGYHNTNILNDEDDRMTNWLCGPPGWASAALHVSGSTLDPVKIKGEAARVFIPRHTLGCFLTSQKGHELISWNLHGSGLWTRRKSINPVPTFHDHDVN